MARRLSVCLSQRTSRIAMSTVRGVVARGLTTRGRRSRPVPPSGLRARPLASHQGCISVSAFPTARAADRNPSVTSTEIREPSAPTARKISSARWTGSLQSRVSDLEANTSAATAFQRSTAVRPGSTAPGIALPSCQRPFRAFPGVRVVDELLRRGRSGCIGLSFAAMHRKTAIAVVPAISASQVTAASRNSCECDPKLTRRGVDGPAENRGQVRQFIGKADNPTKQNRPDRLRIKEPAGNRRVSPSGMNSIR